ncbi:MAG: hypothetical protein RIT27_1217 [Pseudomonadota bacterium]|jgi:hypothetical protein
MRYILLILGICCQTTFAARPLVTDDAKTTDAGDCQLESWYRQNHHNHEFWALPNCGLTPRLDLTIGGGYSNTGNTDYLLQTKAVLKPFTNDEIGVAFVAGAVAHPEITRNANQIANYYAYFPISISFLNDQFLVHTNLGWHYDRDIKTHKATWGLAFESEINDRWSAIGETYGDYQEDTYWQTGLRYSIIPNVLQIDGSVGGLFHKARDDKWFSLGIRWSINKLF